VRERDGGRGNGFKEGIKNFITNEKIKNCFVSWTEMGAARGDS